MVFNFSSRYLGFFLGILLASSCGVKGPPTPYVEAYPEKKNEVTAVKAPAEAVPTPTPTKDSNAKKSSKKKRK